MKRCAGASNSWKLGRLNDFVFKKWVVFNSYRERELFQFVWLKVSQPFDCSLATASAATSHRAVPTRTSNPKLLRRRRMGSKLSWIHCSTHSSPDTMYVKFRSRDTRHTKARRCCSSPFGLMEIQAVVLYRISPLAFSNTILCITLIAKQQARIDSDMLLCSQPHRSLLSVFLTSKRNRFIWLTRKPATSTLAVRPRAVNRIYKFFCCS